MKISLDQNNSGYQHIQPEILLSKENELPVISDLRILRYYDEKLLWRTSNLKLNLLDVAGKSVAEITLDIPHETYGKMPELYKTLEKLTAFDVLIENAARTKYPNIINRNNLNVIPSDVPETSIHFDKKVICKV